MSRINHVGVALAAITMSVAVAACSGTPPPSDGKAAQITVPFSKGQPAASSSQEWTLGTTDPITALDPAGAYDVGSWNLQHQIFQNLMAVPANGSDPEPDAAEACDYTDAETVTCSLKPGLTFSNGNPLTSSDVRYSFERLIGINDPNGAAILLGSITDFSDADNPKLADGAIETPDDSTVIFNLNAPDQTFMSVLCTPPAAIVDEDVYPSTEEIPDSGQQVGSGPYVLDQYKNAEQAVFVRNDAYQGPNTGIAPKVFVRFYRSDSSMASDMQSGAIDVAWRTMTPTQLKTLSSGDTSVLQGNGAELRFWVFNMNDGPATEEPVRQAVAHIIDREAIATNAYDGTVTPAYSLVPPGFAGQKDSYEDAYPEPSVEKAKKLLDDAGIETPVPIRLGYPQAKYGSNAVDEASELAQELNDSGLFDASIATGEWEQYQTDYKKGAYDLFMLGWYPDYLDADAYLGPFLKNGGFFDNNYENPEVNTLLSQELAETDQSKRDELLGQIQDAAAEDVPLMPSWNGLNVAAVGPGMGGVASTLDPTYILRFWMITKS